MELAELEAEAKVSNGAKDEEEFEQADEGDQTLIDIHDALVLLNRCMHLLDYMSDPTLCRTLTKRERETFDRTASGIREFLDEVGTTYGEA